LTIPAVLLIGLLTKRSLALGVQGGNLPLLLLTLAISVVTFTSRKRNVLQGCIHLLLCVIFVLLVFKPAFMAAAGSFLNRSVHDNSVPPLFHDFEPKPLVKAQYGFASHEADRDRRMIGSCAH
jgi:hypothetical protein